MDGSEGGDGRVAGKAPEKGEQVVDSFQDLVRDCSLGGGGSPACWEVESIEGLFQVEDALVQNAVVDELWVNNGEEEPFTTS